MAKLLVHENAGVREYELVDAEIHIGRELDNTLRLPDPSISRHHCVVRKTASGWEIQDLQSSNGVLLNGTRVQANPLRDGDRITLGQVQLSFSSPAEQGATVAMQIPSNPLGTVRMSSEQMAAIHGGPKPPAAAPAGPSAPIPTADVPVPIIPLAAPEPAPMPPPPAPMIPPAPAPAPMASAPMAGPGEAPEFGHFTGLTAAPNPAPGFLQPWLPSIPDHAKPTGERGDFVSRLVATFIDFAPIYALSLLSMFLVAPTMMGAGLGVGLGLGFLLSAIQFLLGIAYLLFIPWCWMNFGATPGKKIMKLRVVPEGNPYGRLDMNMAVMRMLGYLVNAIISWVISIPLSLIIVGGAIASGGRIGFSMGSMMMLKVISLAASIAPYLMILMGERKGLQDMIGKTLVIKVDQ